MLRSSDSNRQGNSNKLASIASKRVAEIKIPNATVPPKLDVTKTENPKNKTIDV